MKEPTFSIVMPSFNQASFLEEAICSVLDQGYPHKELIVMDGGSTDGSVEIIKKHQARLAYWVSQPDGGQSAALNQGFAKASGDLLAWTNSDDVLLPGALQRAAELAVQHRDPAKCWIVGGSIWIDPDNRILRCTRARPWIPHVTGLGAISVYSPSSFFSRELFSKLGPLKEDYHYSMDSELWARFAHHGARYLASDDYFWALRLHPNAKVGGHVFEESGKSDPNHPVWAQRRKEAEATFNRYGIGLLKRKISHTAHRLQSAISPRYYLGKWDTLRYKNELYTKLPALHGPER